MSFLTKEIVFCRNKNEAGDFMFVGRKKELKKLNTMYESEAFEMAVFYGRRRVGKTTLINEFCKNKKSIYFVGLESTEKENLKSFSKEVWKATQPGTEMPPFQDFGSLFEYVAGMAEKERIILVIDEYPYLAAAYPAVSSILQACIDHKMKNSKLFLILCGSSMSFMEHQVLGYKSPLYGRRTAQFKIMPFDFWDANRCCQRFHRRSRRFFMAYAVESRSICPMSRAIKAWMII